MRARAGTATVRAAHVTPTRSRVVASTPRVTVGPLGVPNVDAPPRIVSTAPVVVGPAEPRGDVCPDPALAGWVGATAVVAAPVVSTDKAPVIEEVVEAPRVSPTRRTRAHLGLDVGPTRMHGFDGRILRTSFDGRVQFRRSVDLDLAYVLLADGETTLGLTRVGGAVRLIDGERGFLRVGMSALRLRDSLGPVHGGELLFGFGGEGRRFSTLFDAAIGRLGRSWSIALRWTVGVLLTRGLELVVGVDHLTLEPSDVPDATVRMTTPTMGLRVLL
ncbi:MAG: hypothetical protein H6721_06495 [Sandaracinus sp.]|nr:hypothetical protein [Sandaracinus sp.]MCB9612750.1 hypothetical protein [Sandaracinus sp.]MCB9631771.1 hypothetical protein [Sandaracinus sp.]